LIIRATSIGASQLHPGRLFLQVESFLQSKLQRGSRVGGGSTGDASDVLIHKIDGLRVFEVGDKQFALHLHNFLLTKTKSQRDAYALAQDPNATLT
jgi:hypothetical protein